MKDSEAKLQIALIASNVMQAVGIDSYIKNSVNYSKDAAGLSRRVSDLQDDIDFSIFVAEKLVDLANPKVAGLDTTEDGPND